MGERDELSGSPTAGQPAAVSAEASRGERALFEMFVGRNTKPFLRLYDYYAQDGGQGPITWSGANWMAGFVPTAWFFYRRLYLEGTALILIPVVLGYVFPGWAGKGAGALGLAALFVSNHYYVWRARRKIAAIEESGLPVAERDGRIRRGGGVSITGAVVGTAVMAGLIVLTFPSFFASRIPGVADMGFPECHSEAAKTAVADLIHEGTAVPALRDPGFVHSSFDQIALIGRSVRLCSLIVHSDRGPVTVFFNIRQNAGGFAPATVGLVRPRQN